MITPTGFTPYKTTIADITNSNPGIVTTFEDNNYASNLFVKIVFPVGSQVGMPQINGNVYQVTPISSNSFSIGADTTNFTPFSPTIYNKQIPQVIPVSENGFTFNEATRNNGNIRPEYNYKNAPEPAPRP